MGAPVEEFGPYLVYEQIGIGGMASVHRAETRGIAGFRRPIALKRMLPSVAGNADLVQSFVREAHLAAHLRHENVAQTYDLGKVDDIYFIAMELVPGKNLREILKQCVRFTGPMPLAMALNILGQICDALDYAHNLCDESGRPFGIIHRDVSPSNIIVSDSGTVKLIDFGIAKASAQGMQTMSGTIKGKFGYMAPEYLAGQIDARADLFALGIVSYELLTNQPLFQGKDDMDTLIKVKSMPIPPPSRLNAAVPPEIDAIVMTALERDPDRRWQRASALRMALATETRRLGVVALNGQVVQWIQWAFEREDSEPSISIEQGTGTASLMPPRPSSPLYTNQPHVVSRADLEKTTIRPSSNQIIARTSEQIDTQQHGDGPTLQRISEQIPTHRLGEPPPAVPLPLPRPSNPAIAPLATDYLPNPRPATSSAPPLPLHPSDALRPSSSSIPPPLVPPRTSSPSQPPMVGQRTSSPSQPPPWAEPLIPPPMMMAPPPGDVDIRVTGSAIIGERSARRWGLWIALAVLIVAVGAGVVVYFAWPTP